MQNIFGTMDFVEFLGLILSLIFALVLAYLYALGKPVDPYLWTAFLGLLAALGLKVLPSGAQTATIKALINKQQPPGGAAVSPATGNK